MVKQLRKKLKRKMQAELSGGSAPDFLTDRKLDFSDTKVPIIWKLAVGEMSLQLAAFALKSEGIKSDDIPQEVMASLANDMTRTIVEHVVTQWNQSELVDDEPE